MFDKKIYLLRRDELRKKCGSGLFILPGNGESPMNYVANTYHFRQDSNFLYFFGIDQPDLVALMDFDKGIDIIYGEDSSLEDKIWSGDQLPLSENAVRAGVSVVKPLKDLKSDIKKAIKSGRRVRIVPPYRCDQRVYLAELFDCGIEKLESYVSIEIIKGIISLREIKEKLEIQQIEQAVDTAYLMHTQVMKMAFPGTWEREIAGSIEGIALANGGPVSFPVILSMDGQILHNHSHKELLHEGRMVVADAGCESHLHYASDITRTVPVGGKFSQRQKEIYQIVLDANMITIENAGPEIFNKDLHLLAARTITEGLKNIGLMKGDTKEAVEQGAHALFFPHGLGHMLGLDVHDMESLGENYVGYDETVKRSPQFGTAFLRLAKKLKPGFVMTIEPGIYFIPALIDKWKNEKKAMEFINYEKVEKYKDFGGIRIEDDILITETGCRVLGKPIPKTIADIEAIMIK